VTTVIIPAHNEGRVIGSLLARLAPGAEDAGFEIIVVANGCTDDTAEVASAFLPGVRVLSIPVASKHAALAAGTRAAASFPRIYLDADVELRASDIAELAAALRQPGVLATGPQRVLALGASPWPVRWYYSVWDRLPEVRRGLFGRGVIAVGQPGQERIASLPRLLADDLAASQCFAPHERRIVPGATVTVHPPRAFGDLVRRRIRAAQGVAQMEQAAPAHESARTKVSDLATIVRHEPSLAPRVALFLGVAALARLRARRTIARGDYSGWQRDDSSR
jgi:glycosyltransferase involved in cell wall biosynthesis